MMQPRVPAHLLGLVAILVAPACTDPGPSGDEVGDTGESSDASSSFGTSFGETSSESSSDVTSTASDTASDTTSTSETSTSETSTSETTDTSTSTETSESGTTDTSTDSMGDEPPSVVSTNPAELQSGVAPDVTIEIGFSEVMDPATITTNTADTSCSGSLQLSADDFATCVRMAEAPTSGDDQTFTISPANPLASATDYRIRVLTDVTDAGGTAMADEFTSAAGFVVRYFHTIVIDGTNDFTVDEAFVSSTVGHSGYVAWDDTYVYLGMNSPDLLGNNNKIWWVSYLGGAMGTNAGVTYNTQQPLLPFEARWHTRWRASDDFGGALEWNGVAWIDPGFGPIAGSQDVASAGSFVEIRIAWTDLESPDLLDLHMGMLREQNLAEASWAAIPGSSYVDGYDPNYSRYYEFDIGGSTLPADHDPM